MASVLSLNIPSPIIALAQEGEVAQAAELVRGLGMEEEVRHAIDTWLDWPGEREAELVYIELTLELFPELTITLVREVVLMGGHQDWVDQRLTTLAQEGKWEVDPETGVVTHTTGASFWAGERNVRRRIASEARRLWRLDDDAHLTALLKAQWGPVEKDLIKRGQKLVGVAPHTEGLEAREAISAADAWLERRRSQLMDEWDQSHDPDPEDGYGWSDWESISGAPDVPEIEKAAVGRLIAWLVGRMI